MSPFTYGLGAWADDNQHLCGIVIPPDSGTDGGRASLWIGEPGKVGHVVARVGNAGSSPGVAACSPGSNRAVVAGDAFPHWPPQAERHLITTQLQVVNLSTGAIEYERKYPLGYLGGQHTVGAPDWVLIAASSDARYVAESGVFNGTATIRDTRSGVELAHLQGSIVGFSSDGSRVVANVWKGGSDYETQVLNWSDQRVLWHRAGRAQSILARPNSQDLLLGMIAPDAGLPELVVVSGAGVATTIAKEATVTWPCPCPSGV